MNKELIEGNVKREKQRFRYDLKMACIPLVVLGGGLLVGTLFYPVGRSFDRRIYNEKIEEVIRYYDKNADRLLGNDEIGDYIMRDFDRDNNEIIDREELFSFLMKYNKIR